MVIYILRWWYTDGLVQAFGRIKQSIIAVERAFSIAILAQTLFAPWRRIMTPRGRSLDARVHAALDNFVSRCIGFIIRFFVLIAALISMAMAAFLAIIIAIVWPFIPLLVLASCGKAIIG